jgi:hypothetical protein
LQEESEEVDCDHDIAYKFLDLKDKKPFYGFKISKYNKIKRQVDTIKSTLDKLKN